MSKASKVSHMVNEMDSETQKAMEDSRKLHSAMEEIRSVLKNVSNTGLEDFRKDLQNLMASIEEINVKIYRHVVQQQAKK